MKSARPAALNFTAAPFRSSNLAIPPSPFSPRLPLTPPPSSLTQRRHASATPQLPPNYTVLSGPPPILPLNWVWQCHVCRLRYPLGVTRRCLDDGHFFCAGTTTTRVKRRKNGEKVRVLRRSKPCSSEFDYQGWGLWTAWRQDEQRARRVAARRVADAKWATQTGSAVSHPNTMERKRRDPLGKARFVAGGEAKDCWNRCHYPSECRWGAKAQQASPALSTIFDVSSSSTESDLDVDATTASVQDPTALDDAPIMLDTCEVATTFDRILENIDGSSQVSQPTAENESSESRSAMKAILSALRLSASRRSSVGAPSPLAHESAVDDEPDRNEGTTLEEQSAHRDGSGDGIMCDVNALHDESEGTLTAPASGWRASEPELVMPLIPQQSVISTVYNQETQGSEGSHVPGREKRESKKGYAGYVETLRKVNRG